MDPTELGMNLAAMRCPKCKSGDVLPLNPRDMKTNFECQECHEVVEAEMVILSQIFQYLYDYEMTLLCRKVTARPVTFEDTMRIGRIFPISHIILRIFGGTVLL